MPTILPNPHVFSLPSRLTHDVTHNTTHFHTTGPPWTHSLLLNKSYTPIPTYVRITKPSGEDSFFGTIINNPLTVPYLLCLRRNDLSLASIPELTPKTNAQHVAQVTSKPAREPDVVFVFELAREGLQGHPGTAHGGFLNVLFDEMMGQTYTSFLSPTGFIDNSHTSTGTDTSTSSSTSTRTATETSTATGTRTAEPAYFTSAGTLYTANLSISFRNPVRLPGVYIYRGWVTGRERRKSWVVGEIVDLSGTTSSLQNEGETEDDSVGPETGEGGVGGEGKTVGKGKTIDPLRDGIVCADGTSLWVTTVRHKDKNKEGKL